MVNTFLPFNNFQNCALVLDNKRLGKQRVEAMQIINILEGKAKGNGWKNHVVTKMWNGYLPALKHYCNIIIEEWIRRGFKNTMRLYIIDEPIIIPWFATNKTINMAYRANLLRKDYEYYKNKFSELPPVYTLKYTYIWPSRLSQEQIHILRQNHDKYLPIENFTTLHEYIPA